MAQLQKLLPGYPIVVRDAEALLKEKKPVFQLVKRISLGVFDHHAQELVIRVGLADIVENLPVKLDEGKLRSLRAVPEVEHMGSEKGHRQRSWRSRGCVGFEYRIVSKSHSSAFDRGIILSGSASA